MEKHICRALEMKIKAWRFRARDISRISSKVFLNTRLFFSGGACGSMDYKLDRGGESQLRAHSRRGFWLSNLLWRAINQSPELEPVIEVGNC